MSDKGKHVRVSVSHNFQPSDMELLEEAAYARGFTKYHDRETSQKLAVVWMLKKLTQDFINKEADSEEEA